MNFYVSQNSDKKMETTIFFNENSFGLSFSRVNPFKIDAIMEV